MRSRSASKWTIYSVFWKHIVACKACVLTNNCERRIRSPRSCACFHAAPPLAQARQGLEGDDIFAKGTTCHGDEAGVRAPMLELQHRTTSMRGLNLPTYLPGPSS